MLTEAEITQFKKEGYLVKRGIIDQDYCARARERLWDDPAPSTPCRLPLGLHQTHRLALAASRSGGRVPPLPLTPTNNLASRQKN